MREVTNLLAESFKLTEQEREELLPSGQQSIISNRVAWAKSHLKAAGLLENPVRGRVRISDLGRQVLAEKPTAINVKFLKRFPAYCDFIGKSQAKEETDADGGETGVIEDRRTPLELIDVAYKSLRQATAEDLVSKLKACSPPFFESVVVRLLMAMGYGGVAGHGTVTGKSGAYPPHSLTGKSAKFVISGSRFWYTVLSRIWTLSSAESRMLVFFRCICKVGKRMFVYEVSREFFQWRRATSPYPPDHPNRRAGCCSDRPSPWVGDANLVTASFAWGNTLRGSIHVTRGEFEALTRPDVMVAP